MTRLELIEQKVLDDESLKHQLALWDFKGKKIVFTNGCFDIVHYGHIDYLTRASELGDVLIIGLNTDASVRRLKGDSRPVNSEFARSRLLAAFGFVTAVVLFDEETPYELISKIKPHVLVKGGDYKAEEVVGYDLVTGNGGIVTILPFVAGYSTTGIIEKFSCPKG